ncbi:MAG: aminopeptidase P N-terminal domain-containing protein, partial [Arenicellales bacterium]
MHADIFNRRRRGLMQLMGDGIAIIPTNDEMHRNGDVQFRFRPDSDFYYLTQFPEPDAVAVLIPNREEGEYILFCRASDPKREQWEGKRAGLDLAIEQYGADQAFKIEDLEEILPKLLENQEKVFTCTGRHPEFDMQLFSWVNDIKSKARTGVHAPMEFVDFTYILHELRLFKKSEELRVMRRAAKLAATGHIRAMEVCRPGMYEYEVQASLEATFMHGGSPYPAYPSIVASGENACILHYTENNALCKDGDLLLIDAGAELECYASDITRTFPVNGRYSPEQRALYDLVLAAQTAAIEKVRAEQPWRAYHEAAVEILAQGMIDLGLIKGSLEQALEKETYKRFYMHGTGHWLGMDVHDVGD